MPPLRLAHADFAPASYIVRPKDIVEVLCHRKIDGVEEYLVRWRTKPSTPAPPTAPLSWHALPELWEALHHVQKYIENRPRPRGGGSLVEDFSLLLGRKRKSTRSDTPSHDGLARGFLTAGSGTRSCSPSSFSLEDPGFESFDSEKDGPRVYNAVLQKREGYIVAKTPRTQEHDDDVPMAKINAKSLPNAWMLQIASNTPVTQAQYLLRGKFMEMLAPVKDVYLVNAIDRATPSLNFQFISAYALGKGVDYASEDFLVGCDKCRPGMGQNIGCEYTRKCACLEYAPVDEDALARQSPVLYQEYRLALENGDFLPEDLPKRFPYLAPSRKDPSRSQLLDSHYLDRRDCIYECNQRCRCGPGCKSRVVQKGRRVPLTIFKTKNRGWGVYCNENLVTGEFIDIYLGEVITNDEADRREDQAGSSKVSYLYTLDKFVGDDNRLGPIKEEECYVVDGQYKGNTTRFINHSCEPNCRQFVVSYNKHDTKLYTLAFFATEDIQNGTELTFDYMDKDEQEEDVAIREREKAMQDPRNRDKIRCNCGARKCRGFLW